MATSSRLRGNVAPIFTIKLGAGTAVSYADDLKKYELNPADKPDSDLTFAEAAAGAGVDWTLKVTTIVSFDTGSLFAQAWTDGGKEVTITLGPWGNATPSATKPHFQFTAKWPNPPGPRNEARSSVEGAEVELEFKGTGPVTKLVA